MSFDLKNSHQKFSHPVHGKIHQPEPLQQTVAPEPTVAEPHRDVHPSENNREIVHQWRAPEFEVYDKSGRWYAIAGVFIVLMVFYALYTNGPIMAITFILLGIVGYIHLQKDPRVITFSITSKGIIADKELYLFENIHSFWIFYEEHHKKIISLHTKASMLPYVHIPLADEDPVHLREILMQDIPEIKQDPNLIDAIERVLHI